MTLKNEIVVFVFTGGYYRYDDELVVPIVENTPEEKDLKVRCIVLK